MIEEDDPLEIPEVDRGQYILGYLYEVGPTMHSAFGEGPLTHTEIRDWQSNIGLALSPWEIRTLRRLSFDYLIQAQRAARPDCPPPYGSYTSRTIVAKKLTKIFG